MEAVNIVNTEVPFALKILVAGLQTSIIIVVIALFLAFLIVIFWKNSFIQILVQAFSKILPSNLSLASKKLSKICVAPKIDAEHCSICYCDIEKEVKSNCGHVFCGDCLIKFWHSKKKEKISCPLCRCEVNIITPNFNSNSVSFQDVKAQEIIDNITRYNISCSACPTTVLQLILGSPSSIKIFLESLPSRQGFSSVLKGVIGFLYGLAMLIYMISPQDKIEENDTMFGWIDDSASLIYLFLYIVILFIMVA